MSSFFDKNILEKIKEHETGVNIIENFLTQNECDELLDYFRNLKNKSVGNSAGTPPPILVTSTENTTKSVWMQGQENAAERILSRIETC